MSREVKYCPDCITEMKIDKRQLGNHTKWHRCPSCGLREEIVDEELERIRQERLLKDKLKADKIDERGYYNEEGYSTY